MTTLSPFGDVKGASYSIMELSDININEEEREYVLCVTASGLRREDLHVSVEKKVLTVMASSEPDIAILEKGIKTERPGHVRTLTLPDNADPLLTCATYNNGNLEIHIPKGKNTEEKPLLIHVY